MKLGKTRWKIVAYVLTEVFTGNGCSFFKKLDDDIAMGGCYGYHGLSQ